MFNGDKKKPISIIITTLAAHAYQGESNVLEGLWNVVEHMTDYITKDDDGNDKVANPLYPEENYAEKWIKDPKRKENFYAWHDAVKRDLSAILSSKGASVWSSMNKPFGSSIVELANKRYTDSKKASIKSGATKLASSGLLGAIGQSLNAANTFYGEE